MEPATETGLYLGCNQKKFKSVIGGSPVSLVIYDMSDFLRQCVAKCQELAAAVGCPTVMKKAYTPFLPATEERGPARTASGPSLELEPDDGGIGLESEPPSQQPPGALANAAASILMKKMYAARNTRYDMLKAIDKTMVIGEICVVEKSGGRSGHYQRRG